MTFLFLSIFDGIAGTITGYIETYVDLGADMIKSQVWYIQLGIALVGGLIVILGTFTLIRKLTKMLIVIAILVGLFLIYQNI